MIGNMYLSPYLNMFYKVRVCDVRSVQIPDIYCEDKAFPKLKSSRITDHFTVALLGTLSAEAWKNI